jgi:hypothetical protein
MLLNSVRAITAEVLLLLSLGSGGGSAESAERPEADRKPAAASNGLNNVAAEQFHQAPPAGDFSGLQVPPNFSIPADRETYGYLPVQRREPNRPSNQAGTPRGRVPIVPRGKAQAPSEQPPTERQRPPSGTAEPANERSAPSQKPRLSPPSSGSQRDSSRPARPIYPFAERPKAEMPTQRLIGAPVQPMPYNPNLDDAAPTSSPRKPIQPLPDLPNSNPTTDRRLPVAEFHSVGEPLLGRRGKTSLTRVFAR